MVEKGGEFGPASLAEDRLLPVRIEFDVDHGIPFYHAIAHAGSAEGGIIDTIRPMTGPAQRFRVVLAWGFACLILGRGLYLLGQRSREIVENGTLSRHVARVTRPVADLRAESLGPLAPWVAVLRTKTPPDAVIAFSPPRDVGVALPQLLLGLRLLCYPRRVRLASSIVHEVEATGAMPSGTLFGLNADPEAAPPFPEAWRNVVKTKALRLDRYVGPPR